MDNLIRQARFPTVLGELQLEYWKRPNYTSEAFGGSLDEVRVDNTARSADDIRQAYEIGSVLTPLPLTLSRPKQRILAGRVRRLIIRMARRHLQVLLQLEIRLSLKKMWEGRRRCHRRPSRPSLIPARRMERLFLLRLPPSPQEDFPQMQKCLSGRENIWTSRDRLRRKETRLRD